MATRKRDSIRTQLRQRILSDLHLGLTSPGKRLPSVRTLAAELDASPRIVLGACGDLAAEGLVQLRPRSGIFVAPFQQASPHPDRRTDWLIGVVSEALQHGIAAVDLAQQLRQALTSVNVRAAVIECNDDQLFSITRELKSDYGVCADAVDSRELGWRNPVPAAVQRADVLISTPHHAPMVHALARRLGKARIIVTMCTDLYATVNRLMKTQDVFFVVSDPCFAAKLRAVLSPSSEPARLRILVHGVDDLEVIPEGAPVCVTRITRERMRRSALLHRLLPEERVISRESARELVEFIVRTNVRAGVTAPGDRARAAAAG